MAKVALVYIVKAVCQHPKTKAVSTWKNKTEFCRDIIQR